MNLPQGVVNIRGKQYETVALRVHKFREKYPNYRLITTILERTELCVVMQASISDEKGNIIATGHAEEYRKASEINKTSALENSETSAIGRALAALGIGGTEFASADEVERAISGAKGEARRMDGLSEERVKELEHLAADMLALQEEGREMAAAKAYYDLESNEEKLCLWGFLHSGFMPGSGVKSTPESRLRAFIKANKPEEQ